MKTYKPEDILAVAACDAWNLKRIKKLYKRAGKSVVTAEDIATWAGDLDVYYRAIVLARLLPKRELRLWLCSDVAERLRRVGMGDVNAWSRAWGPVFVGQRAARRGDVSARMMGDTVAVAAGFARTLRGAEASAVWGALSCAYSDSRMAASVPHRAALRDPEAALSAMLELHRALPA